MTSIATTPLEGSKARAALDAIEVLVTQHRPIEATGDPTPTTEQFDLGYRYAMREVRWAIEDALSEAKA